MYCRGRNWVAGILRGSEKIEKYGYSYMMNHSESQLEQTWCVGVRGKNGREERSEEEVLQLRTMQPHSE